MLEAYALLVPQETYEDNMKKFGSVDLASPLSINIFADDFESKEKISKFNISQVFSAETFIIGLLSGMIGIGITLLLLIPGNMIIHSLVGVTTINASLPITSSLVLLSVILTLIGGFIPARHAAQKDPVTALRTE